MPVRIECDDCGLEHSIPDRPDSESGGTVCPGCGSRPYTVRREGIQWHPDSCLQAERA
ncbi:hypothetical protein [Natronorubrum halalkaliphilum]|uniref:hypothetical protein n=1 Tax=Natronorubrum halalkaliphilum TaxID=2691917 RepID=UPI0019160881|nr:hypothetical protein [Natronorubrum halalkaliphilum]